MKYATLAAALVLIVALLTACSSDDEPTPQRQTEQAGQAEQNRTESNATEQRERPQATQQAARSSTEEAEQTERNRTESNTAERSEQPQPAEQAERNRTESNAAQQSDQSQTTEQAAQNRTESNTAEQDQPDQQAQTQAQQSEQTEQDSNGAEQQAQESEQSRTESNAGEQAQQEQPSEPTEAERLQLRAEEISANATSPDVVGINAWLNGEETSIALELAKGNVVLIDFWTYTCINCVRTLPFLTAWDAKYRDHGLVIIGVHTPEFEFEERIENVRAALAEHDIEYLVAIDNDYRTWRAFQNRWWPRKFLIGPTPDGSPMGIRYDHIGEGDYPETEIAIRAALEAVGEDLSDIPFGVEVSAPNRRGQPSGQTRELYMGWRRNTGRPYAGQDAYFLAGPGIDTLYRDVGASDREHNRWYLEGLWRTEEESIVHARRTDGLEDYLALLVRGRTANVVLTVAEDGQPFNVYVELDGRWLLPNEAGSHIQWDDEGRSYIRVTENDLYRLLFLPEWSEHELKLRSDSDQFRIFAFTFGSYVGGE